MGYIYYNIIEIQNYGCEEPESMVVILHGKYGFCNDDHASCYANVILQCAFHCIRIRQQILKNKVSNALTDAHMLSVSCNILTVRRSVGKRFEETTRCFGIFDGSNVNVFRN